MSISTPVPFLGMVHFPAIQPRSQVGNLRFIFMNVPFKLQCLFALEQATLVQNDHQNEDLGFHYHEDSKHPIVQQVVQESYMRKYRHSAQTTLFQDQVQTTIPTSLTFGLFTSFYKIHDMRALRFRPTKPV